MTDKAATEVAADAGAATNKLSAAVAAEDASNLAGIFDARKPPEGPHSALGRGFYAGLDYLEQKGNELFYGSKPPRTAQVSDAQPQKLSPPIATP